MYDAALARVALKTSACDASARVRLAALLDGNADVIAVAAANPTAAGSGGAAAAATAAADPVIPGGIAATHMPGVVPVVAAI